MPKHVTGEVCQGCGENTAVVTSMPGTENSVTTTLGGRPISFRQMTFTLSCTNCQSTGTFTDDAPPNEEQPMKFIS